MKDQQTDGQTSDSSLFFIYKSPTYHIYISYLRIIYIVYTPDYFAVKMIQNDKKGTLNFSNNSLVYFR